MCNEDAQLVEHLDGPEDQGLVRAVALFEVRSHRRGGKMEGECARHDEHGWRVDVDEGQIAYELGLDDCADVREIGTKMVDVADGSAGGDGSLDLAEVLLRFPEEFFRFSVVGGGFALLGEGF